ncbi:hypothetical protein C8J57DRAFT_1535920 [Mycena rebaudengoi]|nr:hypothetical protein C8J57DRAFT_1535920 [Mycena rebaudengoi]
MSFSHPPGASQLELQGVAPYIHNWNVPGINKPPEQPPTHTDLPGKKPLSWDRLKFNPLGCFDLRCRLGVFKMNPLLWNSYRWRFLASDLAWLVAGASDDNQHHVAAGQFFHPQFDVLRDLVPMDEAGYMARRESGESIPKLIFDLATMWDRTFGSTTLILHSEGMTAPGAPAQPEYLHLAITQIAQIFIEFVGVLTVVDFTAGAQACRWPQDKDPPRVLPNNVPCSIVIPAPKHSSSTHYIFRGHPAASSTPEAPVMSSTPTLAPHESEEEEEPPSSKIDDEDSLIATTAHISHLQDELNSVCEELETAHNEAGDYSMHLEAVLDREEGYTDQLWELQQYIDTLEGDLAARQPLGQATGSMVSFPPTYSPLRTPAWLQSTAPFPSPTKTNDISLPATIAFLQEQEHCLTEHTAAIRMMVCCQRRPLGVAVNLFHDMRILPAAKWYKEIARMELDDLVGELLLDCLALDAST